MAPTKDVLAYLLKKYPHKSELSNARVTKMVYLCDWKHAIDHGRQVTDIKWYFDNYGPFVWSVLETARENENLFSLKSTHNFYGNSKTLLSLQDSDYAPKLSDTEKQVADHVIAQTKDLSWDGFIQLIYSTYPILSSERHEALNLNKLAAEYKNSALYELQVQGAK